MFKIIGIRIHEGCDPNIRKVLKEESSYFIYNNYEDDYSNDKNSKSSKWIGIKHRNAAAEIIPPDNFYDLKDNKNGLNISVSAIVGKNGSGKSSLIEIAIRILNNFAITAGFIKDQSSLIKVKGLKATLFYSIDKTIYYIGCDGEVCTWRLGNTTINIQNTNAKRNLLSHSKEVFYTIITNYSMFAYNSLNFQNEDMGVQEDGESWIASLFHKNDGYQTPIVLNPMRTKGNFDVNKEKDLTTQRLLALFTDAGNEKTFMAQNALGYVFSLEKKSKLYSITMESFFKKTQGKKVIDDSFYNPKKEYELYDLLTLDYDFWNELELCIEKNTPLFYKAATMISHGDPNKTDLTLYLTNLIDYCKRNESDIRINGGMNRKVLPKIINVKELINEYCPLINCLQLQRLILITSIWDCWRKKQLIDKSLSDVIVSGNNNAHHHAMLYLVYKTISIFETYKNHYFNSDVTENNAYLFDPRNNYYSNAYLFDPSNEYKSNRNRISVEFNKLYDSLSKEKSFETLKLRQTMNYLKYGSEQSIITTADKQEICGYDNYLSFEQLLQKTNEIKTKDSSLKTIELLPPPIFVGDILFSINGTFNKYQNLNSIELKKALNGKKDDVFTLKQKSSGEQQLLFSIGTLIYHLRNLNSSTNQNDNISYSNVSIILDEVELYFHPEYQRKYINYLLESIAHAGLYRIKNVNICCITHSPFILSDIPKNNVLFLDNGNSVRTMQEDTFGANIHTILQNGFFLESLPIGEFAKKKINELFELLHKGTIEKDTYNLIRLVSEPVLKSQLLRLYHQLSPDSDHQKMDELRKEIELLKEEIKELKMNQ